LCSVISAFDLHALTARLDRSADRILRAERDVSFRRFLTLLIVGNSGSTTQRALPRRSACPSPP